MWNIISLRLCASVVELRRYILGCLPQTHPHTHISRDAEGIPVSYDLLKSQRAVDHISFCVCVCEITPTSHTHTSKDTESNNSVDINKGAIIMNVIRSAEGKEKMSKKIYYPLGCVLKHTFWFSTVQGQMSPLFVH